MPEPGNHRGARDHRSPDLLLPAAAGDGQARLQHRRPRPHHDRAHRRQLPHAVHGPLGDESPGQPHDRRELPPRLAPRLPLVHDLRDAGSQHLLESGELPGLRHPPARRTAEPLCHDQLDHGRRDERADVHAGPVRDLRRPGVRPHAQRHDRLGGAEQRPLSLAVGRVLPERQRRGGRCRRTPPSSIRRPTTRTCSPTPRATAGSSAAPPRSC